MNAQLFIAVWISGILLVCRSGAAQPHVPERSAGQALDVPTYNFEHRPQFHRQIANHPDPYSPPETSRIAPDHGPGAVIQLRGRGGPEIEVQDKIRHLRMAAENLQQAGFDQDAREMRTRAERMERELAERHLRELPEGVVIEIRQLRASLDELREEVRLLRRELMARDGDSRTVVPAIDDTARIRLKDRRIRISDEELDAPSREHPIFNEAPAPNDSASRLRSGDIEFELVPVRPKEQRRRSQPGEEAAQNQSVPAEPVPEPEHPEPVNKNEDR